MKKINCKILATLTISFIVGSSYTVSAQRQRIIFDDDWKFAFGNASSPEKDFGCGTEYFNYLTKAASVHNKGPYSMDFEPSSWDAEWKDVTLPHDWVVGLPYSKNASHSHGYKTVGFHYPETSVGWYRKTFEIPEEDEGKRIALQFDGIFRDARVWVNGFYLGNEPSGYATQIYDISEYLNYGGDNLLTVRADASLEEGWFYEGAGIYRHVWLDITDNLHVAPFGTFVYSDLKAPFDEAIVTDSSAPTTGMKRGKTGWFVLAPSPISSINSISRAKTDSTSLFFLSSCLVSERNGPVIHIFRPL